MSVRKILHIDMDAFYASVEQRDHPELRGKPVVVGGSPEGRGVVCSASYEARRFGIRSAMSTRKARQLCPGAVFVDVHMAKYKEVSRRLRAIFREVTDLVEPLSLDEAYLDVTENRWGEPLASRVAKLLRERIRGELGLTASAGVGPNKFIAKLASDLRKPDALVVVPPERVPELLAKLPVEKLWGVGPANARRLHERGFFTTEDIRAVPSSAVEAVLGKLGTFVHRLSHGIDERPVRAERDPKSRGAERTFHRDVSGYEALARELPELCDDVARALARSERKARTITLKLRYYDFCTVTRQRSVDPPMCDSADLSAVARELLGATLRERLAPVRLLGVSASGLEPLDAPEQLAMPW
jgi:DNA polymerase-4